MTVRFNALGGDWLSSFNHLDLGAPNSIDSALGPYVQGKSMRKARVDVGFNWFGIKNVRDEQSDRSRIRLIHDARLG